MNIFITSSFCFFSSFYPSPEENWKRAFSVDIILHFYLFTFLYYLFFHLVISFIKVQFVYLFTFCPITFQLFSSSTFIPVLRPFFLSFYLSSIYLPLSGNFLHKGKNFVYLLRQFSFFFCHLSFYFPFLSYCRCVCRSALPTRRYFIFLYPHISISSSSLFASFISLIFPPLILLLLLLLFHFSSHSYIRLSHNPLLSPCICPTNL